MSSPALRIRSTRSLKAAEISPRSVWKSSAPLGTLVLRSGAPSSSTSRNATWESGMRMPTVWRLARMVRGTPLDAGRMKV